MLARICSLADESIELEAVRFGAEAKLNEGTVVLREAVRQQGDADFAKVLNEMRVGVVSEEAKKMLAGCHAPQLNSINMSCLKMFYGDS